jgi:osomolarity two-component system sensor histidine kinase NIK1
MASTVTAEVRSINEVAKAVALGDLSKFVDVDLQGEILDMKVLLSPFYVLIHQLKGCHS